MSREAGTVEEGPHPNNDTAEKAQEDATVPGTNATSTDAYNWRSVLKKRFKNAGGADADETKDGSGSPDGAQVTSDENATGAPRGTPRKPASSSGDDNSQTNEKNGTTKEPNAEDDIGSRGVKTNSGGSRRVSNTNTAGEEDAGEGEESTAHARSKHPRVRVFMSSRDGKPNLRASSAGDNGTSTTRELRKTNNEPLFIAAMPVGDGSKAHAKVEEVSSEGDDIPFPPGQLVWTGGRGYRGGLWDSWPGRVVDHTAVRIPEAKALPVNKRAVQLFAREPLNDRRYVVMNVAALRMYSPDPAHCRRRFRDPRGRVACALANVCRRVFGSDHTGPIDEDKLRELLTPEQLRVVDEKSGDVADTPLPSPGKRSLGKVRNGHEKAEKRRKRTAAVNHKFCTSGGAAPPESERGTRRVYGKRGANRRYSGADFERDDASDEEESYEDEEVVEDEKQGRGRGMRRSSTRMVTGTHSPKRVTRSRDMSRDGSRRHERAGDADGSLEYDQYGETEAPESSSIDMSCLGFEEVGRLMSEFVSAGYPEDEKEEVSNHIKAGCVRFKLNGRALLARFPPPEALAKEVLVGRKNDNGILKMDGCYYAVAEFIALARRQSMSLDGLGLDLDV